MGPCASRRQSRSVVRSGARATRRSKVVTPGSKTFGRDLHLFGDGNQRADLTVCGLRDQNLGTNRAGFDARGEVDVPSYDPVFRPFVRANIPHHHFAGVDANPHFDFWEAIAAIVGIDRRHR